MTHYICKGECGGVSKDPGVCNARSCSLHQQVLEECNCDNPEHLEKLQEKETTLDDNAD